MHRLFAAVLLLSMAMLSLSSIPKAETEESVVRSERDESGIETLAHSRRTTGHAVMAQLSGGAGQPVLDALRQGFPFLADAIT
jgi:hypothetical protein